MAKVSLNKLIPVKSLEDKVIKINDVEVTVKQYLPTEKKAELIGAILNNTIEENNDFNDFKVVILTAIEMIMYYTNISITDTQLKDIPKLYDLLVLNKIWEQVKQEIPEDEYNFITTELNNEIMRLRTFFHSALGVLGVIQQDYNLSSLNIDKLIDKVKTDESLALVKDVIEKAG